MFHIAFSVKKRFQNSQIFTVKKLNINVNLTNMHTSVFPLLGFNQNQLKFNAIFCRRCMLKTSNHAGVEGFIVQNIRKQVEISLQVRPKLTDLLRFLRELSFKVFILWLIC